MRSDEEQALLDEEIDAELEEARINEEHENQRQDFYEGFGKQ